MILLEKTASSWDLTNQEASLAAAQTPYPTRDGQFLTVNSPAPEQAETSKNFGRDG